MTNNIDTNIDLQTQSYDYFLPEEYIANKPAEPRDTSKLMVIDRKKNTIEHTIFKNIKNILNTGDTIVLNNTRVLPARLYGRKNYDGALVEVFLIRELEKDTWLVLAKPAKRLKKGTLVFFNDELKCFVQDVLPTGERIVKFEYPQEKTFLDVIKSYGEVPFPPYITKPECNSERYQTVYSKKEGSVAAPTAGLHFTNELIEELKSMGINITYVTLHIGLGTFQPVKTDNILEHKMHKEYYEMSEETAELLNKQKKDKKRIIAVGTTVTRTLETILNRHESFTKTSGDSEIFIYPSYKYKAIDALITNFHLPASTLLMLVSAFWDREKLLQSYETAKELNYKFYSLGDSMIII